METLITLWTEANGFWQKIAAFLPLVIGIGTLLSGLGGFCLEFGHAANAAAVFTLLKSIQSDPNMGLVLAGLGALGVHLNHATNVAKTAQHSEDIAANTAAIESK